METTNKQGLTVGPATENLLLSLRALETARNYYYSAFEEIGGEQYAADMLERVAAQWDAIRDVIEHDITDGLRTWASTNPEKPEI